MPSKLLERRTIGYMMLERGLEVGWRRETPRITLSDRFLATVVVLSTLGTFFTPSALLIKRMLPVKHILFVKRIFSCCHML